MTIASFVTVDITPDRPERLCGFAIPARASTSVESRLEANLACFECDDGEVLVLGCLDTLFVGADIAARIAQRAGIAPHRLVLIASHTHSAPSLSNDLADSIGGANERYCKDVIERVGAAIMRVLSTDRKSYRIGASRSVTDLHVNRRRRAWTLDLDRLKAGKGIRVSRQMAVKENESGLVDPFVRALAFTPDHGGAPSILWTYTAHASRAPWPNRISADFPGAVRTRLRQTFGAATTVLFMPGFAGSTVPRAPYRWPTTLQDLSRSSLPLRPRCRGFNPDTFATWTGQLSDVVCGATQRAVSNTGAHFGGLTKYRRHTSAPIFLRSGAHRGHDVPLDIRRIAFGDTASIVALNGEPLAEWLPLLDGILAESAIPTGYLAGQPLYIPPASVIAEGGYEVEGFKPYFELEGTFAPDIDRKVIAALQALMANPSPPSS